MHELFANTGVQLVCVPLRGGGRFSTAQIGYGWQRCCCGTGEEGAGATEFPYIQWQVIQSGANRLFLAVDTTCGDPELGYFCDAGTLTGDFPVRLGGLLDLQNRPLSGMDRVELQIRPVTAISGEAKHVHMVVDFGNSRSGALLLEMVGEVAQEPQMMPFELVNRYHLDAWDEQGKFTSRPSARWFSSKTHWCNTPYLPPITVKKEEWHVTEEEGEQQERSGGLLGLLGSKKKPKRYKVEESVTPPMFDDLSMVRLGGEADDAVQVMREQGNLRTGLSSPKRYLWAADSSWLEGANWHMADPSDRAHTGKYGAPLRGPLLKYIHEDDNDFLLAGTPPKENEFASEAPMRPQHAPRCMMTAALYELLCQAYTYVNSLPYRAASGDAGRSREIRTLTLTYPSGMIQEEQKRLKKQAQKAINIYSATLGKHQRVEPELNLSIDEASAVHLTYIWSELLLLGQDPRLWFSTLHQDRGEKKPPPQEPPPDSVTPADRRRKRRRAQQESVQIDPANKICVACIDVGGGTSDLMIAEYHFEPGIDDAVKGKVVHQDGIVLGGDQLVKRMLEVIIVPALADALEMEEEDVQLLFGPEVPKNREYARQRITWINRLFVPLAQAYLTCAADDVRDEPISHTDPEIVDGTTIDSLQAVFDQLRGPGYYNVREELDLFYDPRKFEDVVFDVFDQLLHDYCRRIVEHNVDVVLLAGLPSKLRFIQDLVRMYVPLSPSRIVPMHNHYAGNWYPYQDEAGRNPGVIVDPKSPVVVGAAIEFMAANGLLPQFKFEMKGKTRENTYFWGVMTDATSGIRDQSKILFRPQPADEQVREEITEFRTSGQRVLIGRKVKPEPEAQATPVYLLKMEPGDRIGKTDVTVKIKRTSATGESEETLQVDSVVGVVAGEDAVLGENVFFTWRTLADERYYLDTGGLHNIERGTRD